MASVHTLKTCRPILRYLQRHSKNLSCVRASQAKSAGYLVTRCRAVISTPARYFSSTEQGVDQHHSPEEDGSGQNEETQYEHDVRQRILAASLIYVQEYGWTQKALEAGARDEGLPPVAHGMFPRGGAELVHYFYAKCNRELAEILAAEVEQAKAEERTIKTTQFIREAVETRLRMVFPYMENWTQAMALQVLPQNAVESWSNTLNLMDEIWYYVGDRSTDFNWYTKRMSLYGVYKATEIYMLQDTSEDKANTWAFLDNRLADVQKLGEYKRSCEQNSDVFKEAAKGLSIMGRNILGFNSRDR